jgi:hypothetical protein
VVYIFSRPSLSPLPSTGPSALGLPASLAASCPSPVTSKTWVATSLARPAPPLLLSPRLRHLPPPLTRLRTCTVGRSSCSGTCLPSLRAWAAPEREEEEEEEEEKVTAERGTIMR